MALQKDKQLFLVASKRLPRVSCSLPVVAGSRVAAQVGNHFAGIVTSIATTTIAGSVVPLSGRITFN